MARCGRVKRKCTDCVDRRWDEEGKPYCPHVECAYSQSELEWWRRVGGETIIDPISGKMRREVPI